MKLRPEVVEIPFNTERHRQILEAIQQRFAMSKRKMGDRYSKWAEMEDRAQAYIKPTENDTRREVERKNGKPQYTTLEIPYSYAMLLAAHTYWSSVFFGRTPHFQYQGRHGETAEQERSVEALIEYQQTVAGWLVPLYTWLMDMGKYGLGVIGHYWVDEFAITSEVREVPVEYFGIAVPGKTRKVRETVRVNGYSGNRLYNVRPQDFFPDPRVSIARFQEGEFCGRMTSVGWNEVIRRGADGVYFNLDAVRSNMGKWGMERELGSSRLVLPDHMETFARESSDGKYRDGFDLSEMTIEVVPSEWGLGASSYPEKWCFSVLNDTVIVGCQPQGLYHDKFAFDVLEYEVEGYALAKRSMMEVLDPLNNALNWLFNSHMFNVRKVMNDQLVVDPSRVVMKDLTDPQAGRYIRLKPEAYGSDARLAVSQLQVADVTQNHLRDAQIVIEMMQRVTGVVDNVMGMVNSGGRKTATEVRTSSSFGVNRLKTTCEYASAMGFAPLSLKLLANTQQKYDKEQIFRIAGDQQMRAAPIKVTPDLIKGSYAFIPVDGTMPVDRFAQASLWKELFLAFKQFPELAMAYDVPGIMGLIANLSGVKNFDKYRLKATPDDAIANAVKAGNLIPMTKGGPSDGAGGSKGTRDFSQLPQAGAVPGVGRAG